MATDHKAVPTVLANRFSLQVTDRVRIAFGEVLADEGGSSEHFHQAVSLTRRDALELAGMIAELVLAAGPVEPSFDSGASGGIEEADEPA